MVLALPQWLTFAGPSCVSVAPHPLAWPGEVETSLAHVCVSGKTSELFVPSQVAFCLSWTLFRGWQRYHHCGFPPPLRVGWGPAPASSLLKFAYRHCVASWRPGGVLKPVIVSGNHVSEEIFPVEGIPTFIKDFKSNFYREKPVLTLKKKLLPLLKCLVSPLWLTYFLFEIIKNASWLSWPPFLIFLNRRKLKWV